MEWFSLFVVAFWRGTRPRWQGEAILLGDLYLSAWLTWRDAEYPNRQAEDRFLEPFRGLDRFNREQFDHLVDWKHQGWAQQRKRVRNLLVAERDTRIESLTRQTFACFDDDVRCSRAMTSRGLGQRRRRSSWRTIPSATRFIDARALASLRWHDRYPAGPRDARLSD
jgi:hypothetical protein